MSTDSLVGLRIHVRGSRHLSKQRGTRIKTGGRHRASFDVARAPGAPRELPSLRVAVTGSLNTSRNVPADAPRRLQPSAPVEYRDTLVS